MKQNTMKPSVRQQNGGRITADLMVLREVADHISGIFKGVLMRTGITASAVALLASLATAPSQALPLNGAVAGGSAIISQPNATTMNINQTSGNAIINWQGYNIGANESVKYFQPGSGSIALNRVTGVDPSYIYGLLSGNGQVWVINPNGLLVGPGATIQTGSFLASTMNISNDNFMSGRYIFTNSPDSQASIINQGHIQAANGGYVVLAAPSVTNTGSIVANLGKVQLASGDAITLSIDDASLINVAVSGEVAATALGVTNTGRITADGGQVTLTARVAGDIMKNIVNNEGIIEARSIIEKDGLIILDGGDGGITSNSGTLDASGKNPGETGGKVTVVGDKVGLFAGSTVDVSGDAGGGTALIGGNFHGEGPEKNASMTYVDKDAAIKADALVNGDGGKVVVWSDEATRFYGAISAKGGVQGGDGGNAEVSGKQFLAFDGNVDTNAPKGKTGLLLLDPNDLYVGVNPGVATDVSTGPFQTGGGTADYFVTAGTFSSNTNYTLLAGHDVIFNTDVTFGSGVGNSVSVTAANNIASFGHTVSTSGGALTLNASTMSLGAINTGAGLLTINNSGAASQSGIFAGTGGLDKTGVGTLTLSQANTYSGATNINAGAVRVTFDGGLGTAGGGTTVAGGATLALDGTNGDITYNTAEVLTLNGGTLGNVAGTNSFAGAVTLGSTSSVDSTAGTTLALTGVISGTGSLTKSGTGTLILNAANNYTGATNINAGTVKVTANNGLGSAAGGTTAGGTTVAGGATLALDGSGGDFTYNTAEAITLNGGTLSNVAGSNSFAGAVTLGSTSSVDSTAGTTLALTGVISGTGSLTKSGAGTLILSTGNDYTGATNINAGTLRSSGGNAIPNGGAVVLANGAKFDLNISSEAIGSLAGSGFVTLGNGTLTVGDGTNTSFGGVISGTGGLIKQGTGTLTLSNTNSYEGATNITAGTLRVTANGGLGNVTGGTKVASGATLALDGGVIYSGAEAVTLDFGTLRNLAGNNSFAGALTLDNPSAIDSTAGTLTLTGGINNLGFLVTFSGAGNTTVSTTRITNGGGLTKTGTGTLILSGANDYLGTTTIDAGTLRLSGGNALADNGAVVLANTAGAVLDINNSIETIGSLAGGGALGGNVTLGTGNLTVGNGTSTSYGGVISGTGGLTKQGTGTLTLTRTNTYTGATTINAGTLRLSGGNALADSGAVVLADASGAVLDLSGSNETIGSLSGGGVTGGAVTLSSATLTVGDGTITSFGGVISGTGGLTKQGAGTLTLTNSNTYGGITNINGGTLRLSGGSAIADSGAVVLANTTGTVLDLGGSSETVGSLSGGGTLGGNITLGAVGAAALTVGDSNTTSYSGVISGAGGLTKQGSGTLTLTNSNTYGGTTTINGGTLLLSGGSALADNGAVVLANAAGVVLDLNGTSETIGSLSGGGPLGGTVALGAANLTVGNETSTSFGGIINGTGGLIKQGSGMLTLANTNTYTGDTSINAGSLRLSGGNAIADTSAVVLANTGGAILDLSGSSETIGSLSGGGSSGGNVTLGSATLTVVNSAATSFGGIISGTGGLTKEGSGTLTLTNTNMYDGATSINAGTLRVTADGGLGSATGGTTVAGGAKLALDGSGGGITYNTAEAVTLNGGTFGNVAGSNSFAGAVTLGANSTVDSTTGTLTLTGGVTNGGFLATFSGAGTTAVSNTKITGIGGLTKTGSGTLILSAVNDYTGTTTINAGTLQLSGGSAIADAGAVVLANTAGAVLDLSGSSETIGSLSGGGDTGGSVTLNGATLRVGNDTSSSFDGIISGTGNLTKQGSGTLTLTNSNTYDGKTSIDAGTLRLSGGNAIGDSSAVVLANTDGAVLDLNSSNETIGSLSGGGNVTLGTGTLTVGNDAATTFGGVISGAGGLTKQGSGTLTLTNTNTYDGTTSIDAGTLRVTADGGLGSATGGTTVGSGAKLALGGSGINVTYNTAETVILNGGTLSNVAGTNSFAGMVALGANSTIDSTAGTLTLTGGVNNGGYLATFSGAGNTNISTTGITGGGGVTKQGTGTLILSAANDYTGATTINAGTLRLSGGSAIADTGSVVLADAIAAVLDLSGSSETIGSLSGGGPSGGNVSLGLGTLTVGNISSTSFGGVISGSGGLTKQGAGTLTLTNSNLYDGATIVNDGTLRVTANNGLGSAAGGTAVASGATLAVDGSGGNVVYNTAEMVVLNGGTFGNVAGTNSFAGPVTLGAASSIDSTAGMLTLAGGLSNNGFLATFSGAGNTSIVTTGITGSGGLTKSGAGTLILSAANDYSGPTTINAGTLQLSSGSAISDSGTVVLANRAGSVLDLSGSSETIGSLSGGGILGGNVTLNAVTLTVGDETNSSFSGIISGSGGLTKQGSGMLTLTNSNTFDGATRINAGTLRVTADGGLGSAAGGTAVANGATLALDGTGANLYYGTAEALTLNGGTLGNLAGTNSFTGALTVSTGGGTLNILAGSLNLLGAVDGSTGGGGLVINGSGTLSLGNKVGNTTAIGELTTAAGVKLFVNGGIVKSTGAQTYHDDVTIGTLNTAITTANSNVTFDKSVTLNKDLSVTTGSGAITFTGAADGANSLTIDSSGLTTFASTIGHSAPLLSLTIGTATPGLTAINGGEVRTTGNQTYNNAVVLGIDTTLTSSSGEINEGPSGSLATTGLLTTISSSGQDLVGNESNAISSFNATNTTRGDIKLSNISSPLNITGISQTGGGLLIVNGGEITSSGPLTVTGDASISAAGQSITLTNVDNDFSGTVTLAGATTQVSDKNDLAVKLDTSGPTTLAAGADLTLSGTSTDSVTATAVGDVTLADPAASILHITGNTIVGTMSNPSPVDLATTSEQTPITVNLTGSIPFLTFSGDVKTKIRSLGLYNGTVVMGSEMDHFNSTINVKTSIPTLVANVELLGTLGMLGRFDEFFTVPSRDSIIVFENAFKTPEEDPELIDF